MDGQMHGPPQRGRGSDRWRGAAVLVGLITSAALVWQSTQAAFSSTVTNAGNSFTAGSVTLDDNGLAVAPFAVTNIIPGQTGNKCYELRYNGTLNPSAVKFYFANFSATHNNAALDLGDQMTVAVQVATGTCAAPGAYGGDLAATNFVTFGGARTNYGNGITIWDPAAAGEVRNVRISWAVGAGVGNEAQGDNVTTDFVWEVQS